MPGGLFELRRDDITGWWVAVVVDREFDRSRFALPAQVVADAGAPCQNCAGAPAADRVWVRMLKPRAFTFAPGERGGRPGASREAPGRDGQGREPSGRDAGSDEREPSLGLLGDLGSWQTIVAPRLHHGPLAGESEQVVVEMLTAAREQIRLARESGGTAYVQVVQNWGAQAGARTNHLCIDFYDLPQIPHRVGEELGGAARYLIREGVCPYCRLVQAEVARRERLVFEDAASVCFAPYASRSPFELWVVPRHHEADFGRATDAQLTSAAETLRKVLQLLRVLDGPPYNLVLHTAPLHERVDETYHWHWEIHPRLREIAGLELGTGLPVNPVSPEEAVEELLAGGRSAVGRTRPGRAYRPGGHGTPSRGGERESAAPSPRCHPAGRREDARGHPRSGSRPEPESAPGTPRCRRVTRARRGASYNRGSRPPRRRDSERPRCRAARSGPWDGSVNDIRLGLGEEEAMTQDQAAARACVEELYAAHHAEIYSYLCRMLRDDELAADLTQETFVKAFRAFDTLVDQNRARAWLYQIAGRTALDEIRRRRIVRFVPWTGESRGVASSAEDVALRGRLNGELERALEAIPSRQRMALLLAEVHELSGLELAEALGVSHVAARALLSRARESLRQALTVEQAQTAVRELKLAGRVEAGAEANARSGLFRGRGRGGRDT